MRAQFRVNLAVGLAVVMAAAALVTPARAATPSNQKSVASHQSYAVAAGGIAIPPIGSKAHKFLPYLPTLRVAGWTLTPRVFLAVVGRAGFMDRAMIRIPVD